jgi:hypothetical protein
MAVSLLRADWDAMADVETKLRRFSEAMEGFGPPAEAAEQAAARSADAERPCDPCLAPIGNGRDGHAPTV